MRALGTIVLINGLIAGCLPAHAQFSALAKSVIVAGTVDAASVRGKLLCGYQGWFRCPGDAAGMGWIHWSRDSRRIAPDLLAFEMWPDLIDFFAAPGPYSAFLVGGGDWNWRRNPDPTWQDFTADSAPTAPGTSATMSPTHPA